MKINTSLTMFNIFSLTDRCFIQKKKLASIFVAVFLLTATGGKAQSRHELVIVTYGNSTTAPRNTINEVYAVRLNKILTEAGIKNTVINSGKGGSHSGSFSEKDRYKIAHGRDRLDTAVLRYHPDWVTINFGINDSWQDEGKKDPSRISLKEFRENISFFVDHIQGIGGKVILLTPNPIGEKYKGFHRRRLKKYMRAIREVANTKKVSLIDTWKLFGRYTANNPEKLDALLLDGMHPNDNGHMLIAEEISRIIIGSLKTGSQAPD
jgi:lysophospholipase L1-like esterase